MPSWSGLFDGVHNAPYTLLNEKTVLERNLARQMITRDGQVKGAIDVALAGAAVGQTATRTVGQVTPVQTDGMNLGGTRPVAAATLVNRVTVTADLTRTEAELQPSFAPTTYPTEASGNSGQILGSVSNGGP